MLPVSLLFFPHLFHFGQQIVNLGAFPVRADKKQQLNNRHRILTCMERDYHPVADQSQIHFLLRFSPLSNITCYNCAVQFFTLKSFVQLTVCFDSLSWCMMKLLPNSGSIESLSDKMFLYICEFLLLLPS